MGKLFRVIGVMDEPGLLDAGVTTIPGSASPPIEIVGNLSRTVNKIQFTNSTGKFLDIYTGEVGAENRLCLIGPSDTSPLEVMIPKGSRISVRNYDTGNITKGTLSIHFLEAIWA